jgi:hypothetical protein
MAFIAGLLWLPVIINPQWEPLEMAGTSLYKSMVDGILPHVWYQQLLALLLMVMEAYFLIRLNFKYIFIETKTYLPTVFFIFITSVFAKNQLMLPSYWPIYSSYLPSTGRLSSKKNQINSNVFLKVAYSLD